MKKTRDTIKRKWMKSAACLLASGILPASSCDLEQIQALVVGLEAAAQSLNGSDSDPSLGDRLLALFD